jgi:hypothetical protein
VELVGRLLPQLGLSVNNIAGVNTWLELLEEDELELTTIGEDRLVGILTDPIPGTISTPVAVPVVEVRGIS